jgi:HI0933-like protein
LFFIGEVVDVTGHLGGHNFQWAWASGASAGWVLWFGDAYAEVVACSLVRAARLVAAFRFFVLEARLWAAFSFRFLIAFFVADILMLRMDIPFASYRHHLSRKFMAGPSFL